MARETVVGRLVIPRPTTPFRVVAESLHGFALLPIVVARILLARDVDATVPVADEGSEGDRPAAAPHDTSWGWSYRRVSRTCSS